jgi:hypothetical protein
MGDVVDAYCTVIPPFDVPSSSPLLVRGTVVVGSRKKRAALVQILTVYFTRTLTHDIPPLDFALVDPLQHMDDDLADAHAQVSGSVVEAHERNNVVEGGWKKQTNKRMRVDTVDVQ